MTAQIQQQSFYFFPHTNKYTDDKVDLKPIEQVLNEHIKFDYYGSGVNQMILVFVADLPDYDDDQFANSIRYVVYDNCDVKAISFVMPLFYEFILKSTIYEIQALAARTILAALESENLQDIPDFNLNAFRKDIRKLFKEQGWIA